MKLSNLFIAMGLCVALAGGAMAQTRFETDFQVWNDTQFIVPLTKKKDWNFVLWTFGRLGNDVSTVTDARIGGLITKKVNKHLTLGGGYLYRYANPTFQRRRYESRYLGIATFTAPLSKKVTLINRNMYQYEDRYLRPNATIVRSRLWLKREVSLGEKKIEPFISIEPFYDFRLKAFARYRTQAGFSHKFNNKLAADFYYIRQNETGNRTRPGTLNGLGSSLQVNF